MFNLHQLGSDCERAVFESAIFMHQAASIQGAQVHVLSILGYVKDKEEDKRERVFL